MAYEGIREYMNCKSSNRQFNRYEVSAIGNSIGKELEQRKAEGIHINGKTKEGRKLIDQRVAEIANKTNEHLAPISPEDVRLYKKCWALDYMDRTGKCAWGFPGTRARLGYDPVTGLEAGGQEGEYGTG